MQQSVQAARAVLDRLEKEAADLPRRIRNARAAKARTDFDAAHGGTFDPWMLRGAEDVATLEARAVALPRLIHNARVTLAEAELEDVATELEALESEEGARQADVAATAADLRLARDAHDRARATLSAAAQRIAAIKAGILPHRQNVLDQLKNDGQ